MSNNANVGKVFNLTDRGSTLANKQDKLTGTAGQLVGFNERGEAEAQDMPETGVVSFNGREGDVIPQSGDYTADMVGARPDTWTPTASDVGALSADALSSAIDSESEIIAATPKAVKQAYDLANATKQYVDNTISNPNLLDNWYFVDPINQRGEKTYGAYGQYSNYTIDRWIANNSKLSLTDSGIKVFSENTNNSSFMTSLESPQNLGGKTVTLSFFVSENNAPSHLTIAVYYGAGSYNQTDQVGYAVVPAGETGVFSATMTLPEMGSYACMNPCIRMQGTQTGNFTVLAAKLELGPVQTLAHQDANGNWILNDPPDYAGEYAKCVLYNPTTGAWIGARRHSNPNLLDNWYFLDPINQRGQTEYTKAGYAIDRWKKTAGSSGEALSLTEDGIKMTSNYLSGGRIAIQQLLEKPLEKGTYTVSVLVAAKEGSWHFAGNGGLNNTGGFGVGLSSFTFTSNGTTNNVHIWKSSSGAGDYVTVKAVKLERGNQQTLANKEGDTWVLNDQPPDKALELLKCQRYLRPICIAYKNDTYRESFRQFGYRLPLIPPMRAAPTPLTTGNIGYALSYGYGGWRFDGTVKASATEYLIEFVYELPEASTYNVSELRMVSKKSKDGELGQVLLSAEL